MLLGISKVKSAPSETPALRLGGATPSQKKQIKKISLTPTSLPPNVPCHAEGLLGERRRGQEGRAARSSPNNSDDSSLPISRALWGREQQDPAAAFGMTNTPGKHSFPSP